MFWIYMEGRDIKFVGIFFFFFLVEFNRVSENKRVRSHRLNLYCNIDS